MNDGLTIKQINEKLLELQATLASTEEANRTALYQDVLDIRASLRKRIGELTEILSDEAFYLPKNRIELEQDIRVNL